MTKNEDLKAQSNVEINIDTWIECEEIAKKSGCPAKWAENVSRNIIAHILKSRPTVTPADGEAERALDKAYREFYAAIKTLKSNKDVESLAVMRSMLHYHVCDLELKHKVALQTRTPPTQSAQCTHDKLNAGLCVRCGERIAGQDICDCGAITCIPSKTPVPADTIAVPREVLQGVREALKDPECYCNELDEITCRSCEYREQALSSLDAVFSEGK